MALSRFLFPTKHHGQTLSELTSIFISFFPIELAVEFAINLPLTCNPLESQSQQLSAYDQQLLVFFNQIVSIQDFYRLYYIGGVWQTNLF